MSEVREISFLRELMFKRFMFSLKRTTFNPKAYRIKPKRAIYRRDRLVLTRKHEYYRRTYL